MEMKLMRLFNPTAKKSKETPAEFKQRIQEKVVSKFSTGSVHIQTGRYTTEEEKKQRRENIQQMAF